MRRRSLSLLLALACLLALPMCLLVGDVDYDGNYAFLPYTDNVDTVIYPLEHLLVLHEDAESGTTLVYFFTGELGAADLGFSDLRRLSYGFNRFDMDFATPHGVYVRATDKVLHPDPELDAGTADSDDSEPLEPLVLRLAGERATELVPLPSDQLFPTGASRYLRSLLSSDYDVRAYVGVLDSEVTGKLSLDDTPVTFKPALSPITPTLEFDDEAERSNLAELDLAAADYFQVELMQRIAARPEPDGMDAGVGDAMDAAVADAGSSDADDADVGDAAVGEFPGVPDTDLRDALMRTELIPGWTYGLTESLVTSAFELGCWTLERPLRLRVVQIARSYHPDQDGDFAIIHHRADIADLPDDVWRPLLRDDRDYAAYCEPYLR